MTISKAHWDTEGDNVRLSMPFSKVDQERRIVSGFATLDNIDKQMDIVTPEASLAAFSKFRGNIREMHQPSAVGKMVSFKEDKYFDPETKKFYSGIYVSAYVSKGAQDCWEKVLDGTYTGFSIGGRMNKWDDGYDEKMDTQIRIIKDYDLVELSLVDNPANQFASILSVEKVDGVDTLKGDAVDTVIENVFWDKESGIVTLSEEDSAVSPTSGLPMQNIGFVEKSDSEKVDMIKFLVDSAKGINVTKMTQEENNMTNSNEIVNDVAAENAENEVVEIAPEADAEAVTADTEEVAETPEEDAAEAEAEEAEEVAEVTGTVPANPSVEEETVSKSDEATVNAVADLKNTITSAFSDIIDVVKAQSAEITELKKSLGLVESKLEDAEGGFNNLGKRIDAVEADTAFRKSGDLGEIVQEPAMVEKSVWGGSFLTTSDLLK
jgi:flagellin-like hook-associated protein FlgL